MNKFVQSMDNFKCTENGAYAYKSTLNSVLDLFSLGGAYRGRDDKDVEELVSRAWFEDPEFTLKCLFYLRDVRGGVGERRVPRMMLKYVFEHSEPERVIESVIRVPEYGRWDDLIWIGYQTKELWLKRMIFEVIKIQFNYDLKSDEPSLLGKWMPSENTTSEETVEIAHVLRRYLGLTMREYRKSLTTLRKRIKVLEATISRNKWSEVNYEHVPSQAMLKYKNAFCRHDSSRYSEYLESVKGGEKKVNTSTLFPYQIVSRFIPHKKDEIEGPLEVLWNNLPNFINEKNRNALVVCDTSGSMENMVSPGVTAMAVSVSLALYFAEKAQGVFNGRFITFSSNPAFQKVEGETLGEKILNLSGAEWGMTTDLNKVFRLILDLATSNHVPQEDMPSLIYVITDMEFDRTCYGYNVEGIKRSYKLAGYELPRLVFWNVDARNNTLPVTRDEQNVTLVSGLSPQIFRFAVEQESPMEFMLSVLNSSRYSHIDLEKTTDPDLLKICRYARG